MDPAPKATPVLWEGLPRWSESEKDHAVLKVSPETVGAEQSESVMEYWSHLHQSQPLGTLGTKASLCHQSQPSARACSKVHWAMTNPRRRQKQKFPSYHNQEGQHLFLGASPK